MTQAAQKQNAEQEECADDKGAHTILLDLPGGE